RAASARASGDAARGAPALGQRRAAAGRRGDRPGSAPRLEEWRGHQAHRHGVPPARRPRAPRGPRRHASAIAGRGLGAQPCRRHADAFKVSRTPVRRALALLAESNAIEQRPNRGYFLAQATATVSPADVAAAGDDDDPLYYRIAEDRLAARIDERVTEMALVRR